MTRTWYGRFKLGTKRRKPEGRLAFCFSLSPRSSELLWQFLAFGPVSVLRGARQRVPFWHGVTYLPLANTGAVPFLFASPFPLPASPYLKGKRWSSIFCLLFHIHTWIMSCSSLQRGWYLDGIGKFGVFWPTAEFLNYLFTNSLCSIQKLRCLPLVIVIPVI